jgi:hypothetical protein
MLREVAVRQATGGKYVLIHSFTHSVIDFLNSVTAYFNELSWHLPGATVENHRKLQLGQLVAWLRSKSGTSQIQVLLPEPTCLWRLPGFLWESWILPSRLNKLLYPSKNLYYIPKNFQMPYKIYKFDNIFSSINDVTT